MEWCTVWNVFGFEVISQTFPEIPVGKQIIRKLLRNIFGDYGICTPLIFRTGQNKENLMGVKKKTELPFHDILLLFDAFFLNSFSLAESQPQDLQITAYNSNPLDCLLSSGVYKWKSSSMYQ